MNSNEKSNVANFLKHIEDIKWQNCIQIFLKNFPSFSFACWSFCKLNKHVNNLLMSLGHQLIISTLNYLYKTFF